ncbi:hypothetical protein O181_001773 [Austropuccinia psidii MF-1]|uniref:Uncharacterized protein n=1 Tax=Austropuccinia psidii MF-1 TaxID=1389203 RepID=A0A9Q3BBG5_9BASI|nr:hypothetical protein [Austropuccinia psidii MF-1]
MSKPLEGGHALFLTHQEKTMEFFKRMDSISLQTQSHRYKEFVEKPKYFIHRPKEGTGNDPSFGERRACSINQLQTSSGKVQIKAKGPPKEMERSQEQSRHGKRQRQLAQTLPTRV